MKKMIYIGISLIGAALSSLGFAHEQVQVPADINSDSYSPTKITINKKIKPFVFSDILKNNKNFTLAGHYSHYSHSSHSSHFSHRSGY